MVSVQGIIVGLAIAAVGVAWYRGSYRMARLGERLDSIGSKRPWSEVEPADWNVALTASIGLGLVLVGLFVAFLALFD